MTVSAAMRGVDSVVIATDTCLMKGDLRVDRDVEKIARSGPLVAACAGAYSSIELVRRAMSRALDETKATTLTPALLEAVFAFMRAAFAAEGWKPNPHEGVAPWYDASFVITDGARLFETDGSLHGVELEPGEFAVVGSGSNAARCGELAARLAGVYDAARRVDIAASVAARLDPGCREPLRLYRVRPGGRVEARERE